MFYKSALSLKISDEPVDKVYILRVDVFKMEKDKKERNVLLVR